MMRLVRRARAMRWQVKLVKLPGLNTWMSSLYLYQCSAKCMWAEAGGVKRLTAAVRMLNGTPHCEAWRGCTTTCDHHTHYVLVLLQTWRSALVLA